MTAALRSFRYSLVALSLTLLLSSCGGGGGGATTDPAAVYNGVPTQAVLTQGNVEILAMQGFIGGQIGATIGAPSKAAPTNKMATPPFRGLVEVLRDLVLPIDPSLMVQRRDSGASGKTAARRLNSEVAGDDGGWAYYSLDVNDATGAFTGTIAFNGYSSRGLVLTGHATVTGSEDGEYVTSLALAFDSISVGLGENTVTMVGTTSWQLDPAGSSDVMALNMAMVDRPRVYWFRNYVIATTYGEDTLSQTISGRYYNSEYGFVDFHTVTPLYAYYGADYPYQGVVQWNGGVGTSARLSFQPTTLQIQADLDSNNSLEWQKVFQTGGSLYPGDAGPLL